MNIIKTIVFTIVCIVLLFLTVFAIQGTDFFLFQYFAPKYEEAKRSVFVESKEYRHGTIQELDKMRLEHVKEKDPIVQRVLEERALRLTAEWDKSELPPDIEAWLRSIEYK